MKLKVKDNMIILPVSIGDKYYTIEYHHEVKRDIRYDHDYRPVVIETAGKNTDYKIVPHTWNCYTDIVRAIEYGMIGKDIFLTEAKAKERAEKELQK